MTPDQDRMLREMWEQIRQGWPQLGTSADGKPLTLVDGVAALRAEVDRLSALVADLIQARK